MNRIPRLSYFALALFLSSLVHGAPVPGPTASKLSSEALLDLGKKLNEAIRKHQPKRVAYLLKKGASPDAVGDFHAPLQMAVSRGDTAIFRQLLEAGASPRILVRDMGYFSVIFPEFENQYGDSIPLLFEAARQPNPTFTKILLERGADPKMVRNGWSPAFVAAKFDNLAVFRAIVDSLGDMQSAEFRRIADDASLHGAFSVLDDLNRRGVPSNPDNLCRGLFDAIRKRDTTNALAFLDRGAPVHPKDPLGDSPLLQAIGAGSRKLFDRLLDQGADVHAKDGDGDSPILLAAKKSDSTWLKRLLDKGADPHATNFDGRNAMYEASLENLPILLSRKTNLDHVDSLGVSPLMHACKRGRWREAEWMIQAGADVGKISSRGESALSYAVASQRRDVIRQILDRGGSLNAVPPKGTTILQEAIARGNVADLQQIKRLLDLGADPSLPDASRRTPAELAAEQGKWDALALLVRHGANAKIKPYSAKLVAVALQQDDDSLLAILANKGCDFDAPDTMNPESLEPVQTSTIYSDEPALIQAIWKHRAVHVAKLLRHGADPNAKDLSGVPALLLAVKFYQPEIVRLLLAAGVDVSRKDPDRNGIEQYLTKLHPYPQMAKLFSGKVGK
ncbi:MAG: hypothetical protein IPK50_19410 [Fibrobacterota bacterium]|nr:MAG: hypothetical protein IPK50_19410 [Fibrobacterota bacterium]